MTLVSTNRRRRQVLGLFLFAWVGAQSCRCGEPEPLPDPTAAGQVSLRPITGGVEVVLSGLQTPLRTFQVDAVVSGGAASAIAPSGAVSHDIVKANVGAADGRFTVVVGDTRRVPLTDGAIARVDLDPGATVVLNNAQAVDDSGQRVNLQVVEP